MVSNYKENPEVPNFPDLDLIIKRFKETGKVKAQSQMWMYESIARNWCIGKSVLDLGCGIGIGTNILGREAIGAYGVDVVESSINFANQVFGNQKIKFDVYDILKEEPRPTATFDVVCMLEVIEHIKDYDLALANLRRFHSDKRNTVFFISSPNRNSDKLQKDTPRNPNHVREWSAGEFYEVLTRHFKHVVLYGVDGELWFEENHTVDGNTDITPVIAKVEMPI